MRFALSIERCEKEKVFEAEFTRDQQIGDVGSHASNPRKDHYSSP